MEAQDAQAQISQMISFIATEAQEKANDIHKKGEEEFSIEVHRLITEQKEKIRQNYEKKVKQIETSYAIAKSMAINKQRLEKIKARQAVMQDIAADAKKKLAGEAASREFITKLIVQGLLMLLEKEVIVRCRKADVKAVTDCLKGAQDEYAKVIKAETGQTLTCTLKVDEQNLPPAPTGADGPSCLGGVMLLCHGGKITIDNTIDSRLALVMEQAKPAIRGLLFPSK
jgi:V-type H+-transporting ATPase subunit E